MSDNTLSIVVPIITVVISILASVIITTMQNRAEMKNLREQMEQNYSKSLFDKRVEAYPELWSLLCVLGKAIFYDQQTVGKLIEFRNKLDSWDIKYGVYLSQPVSHIYWRFVDYLRILLLDGTEAEITQQNWEDIARIRGSLQQALRAEIGIFDTNPVGKIGWMEGVYEFIDERRKQGPYRQLDYSQPKIR